MTVYDSKTRQACGATRRLTNTTAKHKMNSKVPPGEAAHFI
jgi:hypothetical protein